MCGWAGALLKIVIDSDFARSLWHGLRWFLIMLVVRRRESRAKGGFRTEVDKHLLSLVIHFWLSRKNQEEIKEQKQGELSGRGGKASRP